MKTKVLFLAFLFIATGVFAEDTLTVRNHDRLHMDWANSWIKKSYFPTAGKTYRRAWLTYNLGCPDKGCSDWDYTTKVFILRPTGELDTAGKPVKEAIEIMRYITPYSNGRDKNFHAPFRADITDFVPLLKDSVEIQVNYEGYSDGFTVTLDFQLIEGTPPHDVAKIERIYDGYYTYGDPNNPIEDRLIGKRSKMPTGATAARLFTLQTGHGGGGTQNCAEFCKKSAYVLVNDSAIGKNIVWRDDCGLNVLFPQPGTWLYDRANWCPGSVVTPYVNDLTPFINPTDSFKVDIDMDEFVNSAAGSNPAGYNIATQLIYYKSPNFQYDVEVEDIMAPTNNWLYGRQNPACDNPKIRIRNNGAETLTSLKITYGLPGGESKTYDWSGNLPFLKTADVTLPSINLRSGATVFNVQVSEPNGKADQNTVNDKLSTAFTPTEELSSDMIVMLKANGAGSQSEYTLYDGAGNALFTRKGFKNGSLNRDTLHLPEGCYRLTLIDKARNGLSFYSFNGDGNGSFRIMNMQDETVWLAESNFGTNVSKTFYAKGGSSAVHLPNNEQNVRLFPNPANDKLSILLTSPESCTVNVYDNCGKRVSSQVFATGSNEPTIDVSALPAGLYIVHTVLPTGVVRKPFVKVAE